jgi:hypothetical protein
MIPNRSSERWVCTKSRSPPPTCSGLRHSLALYMFWLLSVHSACAQSCPVVGPRYSLNGDTVHWSMRIASGRRCVRGVRFSRVVINSIRLVSPPLSGRLTLQGPGFTYIAKPDFNGQDSFSLEVFGMINGGQGNSIIQVTVYGDSSDRIPPSISITAPANGAIVSGSAVTLIAAASDKVGIANVRFICDANEYIGSPIISSPYTTTWNSASVADGPHTIYAVAQDTSGNYGTASIKVTVENGQPKQSTGR